MKFRLQQIIARHENSPPKTCSSRKLGGLNPGDAKSASRTRLNQFSAGYFRWAQCPSVTVPPPPKGPVETGPEGSSDDLSASLGFSTFSKSVSKHLVDSSVDVVGLGFGGDSSDGLHETALLSLLKARATFALELNFEQKLIYISQIDIRVKTCYTITDEKNSGDYLIPRNVRWRVR